MGWICRKCFTENGSEDRCTICATRRPGGAHVAPVDNKDWRCLLCGQINPPGPKGTQCNGCAVPRGMTPQALVIQERKMKYEEELNSRLAAEYGRKQQAVQKFVSKLASELKQEDPQKRIERMRLHKLQYQMNDLKQARQTLLTKRQEINEAMAERRREEELERVLSEERQRQLAWLSNLGVNVPEEIQESIDASEITVDNLKQMGYEELVAAKFSLADAKRIVDAVDKEQRQAAIAAGETVDEDDEKKVPMGPSPEELAEIAKKAEEEAKKKAAEAEEVSKREAVEHAVRQREEKQKVREQKQAERREAAKVRQAKAAAEKKKKEELRIARLKEKAELAKAEARRKEEETYEAERTANRAKMTAFFAAERERIVESEKAAEEEKKAAAEEKSEKSDGSDESEEEGAPPVFLSSGGLLADLEETAFTDTGGELRLGLLGLSTTCATIYMRSKVIRREIKWILKNVIKIYGDNVICTTPLADEIDLLSAEVCLSLGLQLRAVLPPARAIENAEVDVSSRSFNLDVAVNAAIGPKIEDIHPEYHATVLQRQNRLRDILSKEKVSVFHIPSREWDVHGYHCVRALLTRTSDILVAAVDAIPSPTPPCLLWDTVRYCLQKKTPMIVLKSHESSADVHSFKNSDKFGRALLARYSSMPYL